MGTDVVKNVNKNNASHAVLFEALALVSLHHRILAHLSCNVYLSLNLFKVMNLGMLMLDST